LSYAKPGCTLLLQGRNKKRLNSIAQACEANGASVITYVMDLRNRQEVTHWLQEVTATVVLDLVIVNAGLNTNAGTENQGENWQEVEALIEVNVLSAMLMVDAVLPDMRRRRQGQIVLI